jgi:putative heme-binding domain-containing protein
MSQIATNESGNNDERMAAARLLCRVPKYKASGVGVLAHMLKPQVDVRLQSQAIGTIAQTGIDLVPIVLAKAWPELSPDLRNIAIDAWLSRESWTTAFLDQMENGQITASNVSLTQRARLLQHPTPSIAQRAKLTFDEAGNSTRKDVVQRYQTSLDLTASASQGQLVYARACANCHRRGETGHNVGPDLATVINHSKEKLLTNILDPNADIQPGYQSYSCLLESGEILAGLLASETTNSVTIKQANGVSRSIARREIERLQSSNLSFMPEGLEATLTQQELADLIAFLQQPIPPETAR